MEKQLKQMPNIPDTILALLQKDIAEIKVALLGNEYNPAGGLLYRTADVEKQLEILRGEMTRMSDKYNRIIWTVGGGATVITVLASLLFKVFDKIVF